MLISYFMCGLENKKLSFNSKFIRVFSLFLSAYRLSYITMLNLDGMSSAYVKSKISIIEIKRDDTKAYPARWIWVLPNVKMENTAHMVSVS